MQNFLERNLIFLSHYNEKLALKIANLETLSRNFSLEAAESCNAIICIEGFPTSSPIDPHKEAQEIFNSLPDNEIGNFCVLAGIETGYIFEHFVQNCKGFVVLFEPCIESLRVGFELIDLSASLKKSNVFVVTNEEEFDNVLAFRRRPESKIYLCANKFYEFAYKDEIAKMQAHIDKVLSEPPTQRAIF